MSKRRLHSDLHNDEDSRTCYEAAARHDCYDKNYTKFSQSSLRDLRSVPENSQTTIRSGIVLRMKLKNFMCHEMLDFEFSPAINFIIGPNGSGKSSIMNAICLGLGGKASSTSRGSKISSFINNDSSSCEIVLTLSNECDEAYCPEKYGPRITISRKIFRDGSSTYRVLDHAGHTKGTTHDDVMKITDHFNIQVDNPVSMLNQETAKTFLNSQKPKDLYKFFLKAAQLDCMRKNYDGANKDLKKTYDVLMEREKSLAKFKSEAAILSKRLKFTQSIDSLKSKVAELKLELALAKIYECDELIRKKTDDIQHLTERRNLFHAKITESDVDLKMEESRKNEINSNIKTLKEELVSLQLNNENIEKEIFTKKQTLHEANRKLNVLKAKLRHENLDYNNLLKQSEEYEKGAQKKYEDEFHQHNLKVKALEKRLDGYRSEVKAEEAILSTHEEEYSTHSQSMKNLMAERKVVDDQLIKVNEEIRRLEQIRSNDIKRYGPNMPEILKEIDRMYQQKKISRKPIGPIGLHLKVKNKEWALATEQCIGKIMNAFICENYNDENELQAICQRFISDKRFLPKIIVSSFETKVYDVSRFRPRCVYPTVYEMLEIVNPAIACVLIDQLKIETILLIPNRAEARALMERNCPENCTQAFLLDGTNVYGFPSYKVYCCEKKTPRYFSMNVGNEINEKQVIKAELLNKRESFDEIAKKVNNDLRACSKKIEDVKKKIRDYSKEMLKLENNLSELKSTEVDRPPDISFLTEELTRVQKEMQSLQQESVMIEEEHAKLTAELKELLINRKTVKDNISNTSLIANDLKTRFEAVTSKYMHISENRGEWLAEVKNSEECLVVAKQELGELIKKRQKMEVETNGNSFNKFDTKRNANSIVSEIAEIEKQIVSSEKETEDEREITEKYNSCMDKITDLKTEITRHKAFSEKLNEAIKRREVTFDFFKECASVRCGIRFGMLLHSRDCEGSLEFNHEKEEVNIRVRRLTEQSENKNMNVKNMSGGERSFCTICFLLALWDVVDQPVRCLDEFDVFMDQINRTTAMTMMLHTAKFFTTNQFIFISPQETKYVLIDFCHYKLCQNFYIISSFVSEIEKALDKLRYSCK